MFLTLPIMSEDSTVSSSSESIDDTYAIRHEWHSLSSQNESSGTFRSEISEFLRYLRNFFDRVTGGLPKDEEAACYLLAIEEGKTKQW